MTEREVSPERQYKSRGAGIIFYIRPTDQLMFFLRDDKPGIPFPGKIDIIGGHLEAGEAPEQAARREASEEFTDKDTGEPYQPGLLTHFKTWVDERPGQHNIYVEELDNIPNVQTNEGQGLVLLSREEARQTDFAFGYSDVVNELLDSL